MSRSEYSEVTEEVIRDLGNILGPSNVSVNLEKRQAYSRDEVPPQQWGDLPPAEVLCFPESTGQVSKLLSYADQHRIPVTPRGAGTGLSGGAVPSRGGILLSFEKMNRILELDTANLTITVEPGVITSEITKAAQSAGLLYAGDPCSGDISTIGGNVAENAGGNKVVKYGATGNHVLGLEVVLPDGSISRFGGKRRKDVTGYDLVHLIVGSEGTLAVVTKIILKLFPLPRKVIDLLIPFQDTASAIALVPRLIIDGKVMPSTVEFMDKSSLQLVKKYLNLRIPCEEAGAHLIVQLEGNDPDWLRSEILRVGDLCRECGALEVFVAESKIHRNIIWKLRKGIAEEPWAHDMPCCIEEDIVAPIGEIPSLMNFLRDLEANGGIRYIAYGHVGDGNMHMTLFTEKGTPDSDTVLENARLALYRKVNELGGTLTGEHGVGLKRRNYLPLFLDEAQIRLLRRIKKAFDPHNILNPGKITPPAEEEGLG